MKKKLMAIALVLILAFGCIAGCSNDSVPKGTDIVASIGTESISYALYCASLESYMSYLTQIGGSITSEDDLTVFQDMIMDYLIMDMMALYNAQKDGFSLSDEERQKAIDQAESEIEDIRDEYIASAEADYEKDPSKTVDEYFDEYIATLSEYYLGIKMNFDEYSEAYKNEMIRSRTIEAYKDYVCKDFVASEGDIVKWYDEQHASDVEAYASFPEQFKFDQEYFEKYYGIEYDACPVTYVPKGYSRIMDIVVKPNGELSEQYENNQKRMKEIYAECSELTFYDALNGDDANAAEIAELLEEYRRLDAECASMHADYIKDAKAKIDEAYSELESGADFAEVMLKYSENTDVVGKDGNGGCEAFQTKGQIISLVYDCDKDWSPTVKEIFGMIEIGEYSNVFEDEDGSLHIIKYVSDINSGDVPLDDIRDEVTSFVKADSDEAAWNELMESWLADPEIKRNTDLIRSAGKDLIENK